MDAALVSALAERYLLDRELGAGGMATVYLAPDLKHDRLVAIKALKPELAAVIGGERFLSEIKTTANLQHPHILALFDSGGVGGLLFYATPFMGRERLTGDPPHKGSTVQAVIAKVITEQPGRIRAEAPCRAGAHSRSRRRRRADGGGAPRIGWRFRPRQVMRTPVGASHESQAA